MSEDDDYDEELAEQIDALRGDLSSVYGQIVEMSSEIDDYLAEYRYDAVEQTIESISALITSTAVEDLAELGRLCLGADSDPGSDETVVVAQVPRLAAGDLPVVIEPEEGDDYDEVVSSLREREDRCADHVRRLFDCAEQLWEQATAAAEAGRLGQADEAVSRLRELPAELTSAYSLWELSLVALYNDDPGNLGYVGDMVATFESRLVGHR
ncbi:hypothetical protein ACQEUX_19930 [Micromonospora sp. CA-259024]|uniref:hypothetical protein n=1 Tax=Micromonospora sp. CA-259024 TaxID=3239965 RepID=UPI003D8D9502